jgi:hypothetical protein
LYAEVCTLTSVNWCTKVLTLYYWASFSLEPGTTSAGPLAFDLGRRPALPLSKKFGQPVQFI